MNQQDVDEVEWRNPANWSAGLYFSKRDSRVWVPKQIRWMGWTLNLGTKIGAYLLIGLLIGLPVSVILLVILTAGD